MVPPPENPPPAFAIPKRDFIGKPAPPGYVAGIGRGATGFTTRSDIGPAREAASSAAGPSTGHPKSSHAVKRRGDDDDDEEEDLNESNYDEFAGYGGSLFNKDPYEEDDEEADKIYAEIDKHLDERGKALREAKTRRELEEYRQKRPKIQQQFSDLKSSLQVVSEEEWMSIPDVGDARNRKQRVARQDKYTAIPDSLLAHRAKLAAGGEKVVYLDAKGSYEDDDDEDDKDKYRSNIEETGDIGTIDKKPSLPLDGDSRAANLSIGEMSEFRSSYMSMQLSQDANKAAAQMVKSTTDAHDYLTNLQSMVPKHITDSATLNDYRKQFASLRASNPTFENAWIASIRLEEAAGKLSTARALALEACDKCSQSADLWLEAIRLHPPDYSKPLLVKALKKQPRSEKLWLKGAELEPDDESRRKVFDKARQLVPKSVLIWKRSAALETPERARLLLREAVECCPDAVELWLALARLESNEEANKVLVRANEKNPTDRSIWIMAAKLQEQIGNHELIGSIVSRALEELKSRGVEIKRTDWFMEAMDADRAQFKVTCREIIRAVINLNLQTVLEGTDAMNKTSTTSTKGTSTMGASKKSTTISLSAKTPTAMAVSVRNDSSGKAEMKLKGLLEDAKHFVDEKSIDCARAVFSYIKEQAEYRRRETVWLELVQLEREHGDQASLLAVLSEAIKPENCIGSVTLWMLLAKERADQLDECRSILSKALDANPDSEKIVLAAVELECNNGNHNEARRILSSACKSAKTAQLVMRASKLEWSLGNLDEAIGMLRQGVSQYKNHAEFYISLGQIEEQQNNFQKAKQFYSDGLKFNPTNVQLWISIARLEEKTGSVARARSKLEMARLRNPRNVELWLEAAQLECRQLNNKSSSGGATGLVSLLSRAIKECKDCKDVEKLRQMLDETNKRKW